MANYITILRILLIFPILATISPEQSQANWKDVVAKATEKALVDFKNPYDSSKTSVTHGGGVSNDTDVGFNRMRSPGTTIKVMTCITTPCTGTMCTVPNHLCSKDITIN